MEVAQIESTKDNIKNPHLAESNVIPKLGTSSILNGKSGSGKSTLLINLLLRYKGVVNKTIFISPTADVDDINNQLKIDIRITNMNEAPDKLKELMDSQLSYIARAKDNSKAPQVLVIFDDVVGSKKLMNSPEFVRLFIGSRHFNMTVFLCSQSWTAVPRRCRLQASHIFFFRGALSEVELLYNEYCPPSLNKKRFFELVDFATKDKHSFLHINMKVDPSKRFVKNLSHVILH